MVIPSTDYVTLGMKMLQKWMMRLFIVVAPEDFFK